MQKVKLCFMVDSITKCCFQQDIVFLLILAPIRSGLRGFCLFILETFLLDYRQKKPLKYHILHFGAMYRLMVNGKRDDFFLV